MIGTETKVTMDTGGLTALIERGSKKAMYRASGLLMRMARQKIRYRSYMMKSDPGNPPFKHMTGANSFSHSIRFAVDPNGMTSVIGPERQAKPGNPGGPAPHTLEFGGISAPGNNTLWFTQSKRVPPGVTTVSQVADFFKSWGWGPLFLDENRDVVAAGVGRKWSRRISHKKAPIFKSKPLQFRTVYYFSVKMRTMRQARRAAENAVKYFGYPVVRSGTVKARPYMGPTLVENFERIHVFWRDVV